MPSNYLLLDLTLGSGFAMVSYFCYLLSTEVFLMLEVIYCAARKSLQQYFKVVPILHTLNVNIYYYYYYHHHHHPQYYCCCCCCCCVVFVCQLMFFKSACLMLIVISNDLNGARHEVVDISRTGKGYIWKVKWFNVKQTEFKKGYSA